MDNIEEQLRTILSEQMGVAYADIKTETKLVEDLGCDSLDLVELVMAAEEEIGIELPDTETGNVITFGDAVNLLRSLKK